MRLTQRVSCFLSTGRFQPQEYSGTRSTNALERDHALLGLTNTPIPTILTMVFYFVFLIYFF